MTDAHDRAADFLRRFIAACPQWGELDHTLQLRPFVEELKTLNNNVRAQLARLVFRRTRELGDQISEQGEDRLCKFRTFPWLSDDAYASMQLGALLLRRRLPLTRDEFAELLRDATHVEIVSATVVPHVAALVGYLERCWDAVADDDEIRALVGQLAVNAARQAQPADTQLARRLDTLVSPAIVLPLEPGEAWTDGVLADLEAMDKATREHWGQLLSHCLNSGGARPTAKWNKIADSLLAPIGHDALVRATLRWFPLVDRPRTAPPPRQTWWDAAVQNDLILEPHAEVLRGLCWLVGREANEAAARALAALALSCYRRVAGVGPRAVKVGHAAIYGLGQMPGREGLAQLALLQVKVKFIPAQKMVAAAFDRVAEREGLPRDEIEELAVPSYGFDAVGESHVALGNHTATLRVGGASGSGATTLTWQDDHGKRLKSVPAAVRREHADALTDLRGVAKDVQKMLPAQRDRIDSLFLTGKFWPLATWRSRYLDHALIGTLARRLIWLFASDDAADETAAMWLASEAGGTPYGPGRLVRVDGSDFEPRDDATVRLWHPIPADTPAGSVAMRDDIQAWRAFLETNHIQQPFKQAHREVYLLTEAERATRVYSNRFAAHFVRQHQLHALCGQRGWRSQLRLMVDDFFRPPTRPLSTWGLRAEFWGEAVGDGWQPEYVLESGAFRYIATDQVRFYAADAPVNMAHCGGGDFEPRTPGVVAAAPVPLAKIPPLVLSEVLRDVDLFVSVASVGNNPEWIDGGPDGTFRDYWHSYSFGKLAETAATRRELLQRLIPRLSIADACTVTERFLVVLGKRRTYKIHFGSGSVVMEPNDQYLCIVPKWSKPPTATTSNLFLPFEGDQLLALILSKAFLLAADDEITDPTILAQIEHDA